MRTIVVVVLFISLVSAATLKLQISSGSNKNWIAVMDVDEALPTSTIEIKQTSTSWIAMTFEATGINAGYWTYNDWSKAAGFDLPLSFRLTGSSGSQITFNGVVSSFPGATQTIDSGTQYANSSTTKAPTARPTAAPTTKATTSPTIKATIVPTQLPGACSDKTKVLVPLYLYPGATWDPVIASASYAKTVAIINPNSGPGGRPDSTYLTYLQKLKNAGVEMVGYVHTSWGARAIADVKADIDTYASYWGPYLVGIFLDEASEKAEQLPYYSQLHTYIMAKSGYKYNIINPGIIPDVGYLNVSTTIVTFENTGSSASSITKPTWASCQNKEKFAAIAHSVSSGSMQSVVNSLAGKGYFGYMYVTDGAAGCCTYNALATYYSSMASYIGSK